MRALKSRAAFGSLSSVLVKIFQRSCYMRKTNLCRYTHERNGNFNEPPVRSFSTCIRSRISRTNSLVDLSADHNVEIVRFYRFRENRQSVKLSCRVYVFAFHIYVYEERDIPDKLSTSLDFHIQLVVDCLPVCFFS